MSFTILQVIPQLDAGGAERTTLEVAEAIVAEGGRALVATAGGRLEGELEALGGELLRIDARTKNPWLIWRHADFLSRMIRTHDVDLVHARSRAPAWSAMWAARRCGKPFVTTYHGAYNARTGLKRWYNSVMARGDRVIANSQFIADHVRAEHGVSEDRLRVIPRGVDLDGFTRDAVDDQRIDALRRAWGVAASDDRPVLLLPARLTAWKGQEIAIRAYARARADGAPAALMVLAGDDQGRTEYRQRLETLIAEHDLSGQVILPGHCADMPAALALADIVLTPSVEPEAFGRTTAEAGAMARPVIAFAHGGACEIVRPGETGFLAPPGDLEALASAIGAALAMSAQECAEMGAAARERVAGLYSKSALQSATLQVYRELLD